jgi:hypothetical protein
MKFYLGTLTSFFSFFSFDMFYLSIQEHHIQTNHGPVSVAVYGDHDKPALVTYPDIALNRKFYPLVVSIPVLPADFFQQFVNTCFLVITCQICPASKDYCSVLKPLHCCFIIFVFTISAPQGMRLVVCNLLL